MFVILLQLREGKDGKEPERRLPSSTTCSMTLWLPRDVSEPNDLTKMMIDSIELSAGFGKL
jgi:hypothetical protein